MIGQLSIDGEELTGLQTVLPGLATLEWPEDETLRRGDRVGVYVEFVCTHVQDGAPVDSRAIAKETVKRTYLTAPDKASVKVQAIMHRQSDQGAA